MRKIANIQQVWFTTNPSRHSLFTTLFMAIRVR